MDDIIKLGFQQRIGDLEFIGQAALAALGVIALGDRDTISSLYAKDFLNGLSVDLDATTTIPHLEQAMQHLGWPRNQGAENNGH